MPTNLTGAQGDQTLNVSTTEYNISGNCTQNAGTTTAIIQTTTTINTITWGGNFNWTSSTSGKITCTGIAGARIRFGPSGVPSTWSWGTGNNNYIYDSGTGGFTFIYVDLYGTEYADIHSANNASVTYCRIFWGSAFSRQGFYLRPGGGTNTYTDLQMWGSDDPSAGATPIFVAPNGGTNTFQRIYANGTYIGIEVQDDAGTNTFSDWKCVECFAGVLVTTLRTAITNLLTHNCGSNFSGTPGTSVTLTRWFCRQGRPPTANTLALDMTPGVGVVVTFDEAYIGSRMSSGFYNRSLVTARMVVQNSVITHGEQQGYCATTGGPTDSLTSSGNDIVWMGNKGSINYGVYKGTSDNDFLAGNQGAWAGSVPCETSGVEGPLSNWADSNVSLNIDTDSGNTTSTSTPIQYGGPLDSNRTTPRATPNKPLTVSSIVATPGSNTVNITWTTGIKARSRVLIGTTSGVTRANATSVSPWKYHGILDPEMVDFTLPVTSHSHDIALPPGTYFAVPENYDPCGRRFLGAETSFTIAGIALAISTTVLDDAQLGVAYNAQVRSLGGTSPYAYDVSAGSLPTGLTLNSDGSITGTPTALGTGSFTARVTDDVAATDTQALSIAVGGSGLAVAISALDDAQMAKAYHAELEATGGLAPYTYAVTAGALNAGLSLDGATGVISGTVTSMTTGSFTITVTDAMSGTATKALTITVNGGGGGTPAGSFTKAASQLVG